METQNNIEGNKAIQRIKVVYRLHMTYVIIICSILMICTLCIIPRCVSAAAFQNFSFASTIVSIVLAVVSIVYSLWSGQKSNNQYVGMAHIESKIDEQLKGFERIEESIYNKLNPINREIEQIKDDQIKTRQAVNKMSDLLGDNNSTLPSVSPQQYIIKDNPLYADLSLYIFALSYKHKKTIPVKLADKLIGKYWSGFIVAFSRSQPDKLNYKSVDRSIQITAYQSDYFGSEHDIKTRILKEFGTMAENLKLIDNAFEEALDRDETQ